MKRTLPSGPPPGGATFLRQARERGAHHIGLIKDEDKHQGLSLLLRKDGAVWVDQHNVFKIDRTDMGMYNSPAEIVKRPNLVLHDFDAAWLIPFLRKLVDGDDFTWEDLETAAGHPLLVNHYTS